MDLITRKKALARGLPRYFTGQPCKRGHVAERIVANKTCVECRRERARQSHEENREAELERLRRRYEANREAYRERQRQYYIENRDRVRESVRQWREANPEKVRELKRQYAKANREKVRENSRRYRESNPEKVRERNRQWSEANPAKLAAYAGARRAQMTQSTPRWAESKLIEVWYALARVMSETSGGEQYQVDHIVPLKGKTVCGLHVQDNFQIITARENASKGNRFLPDDGFITVWPGPSEGFTQQGARG